MLSGFELYPRWVPLATQANWVCSFTAFTTTGFLSYVSCSLTVFCLHVQGSCLGHGCIWVFFYFYLL